MTGTYLRRLVALAASAIVLTSTPTLAQTPGASAQPNVVEADAPGPSSSPGPGIAEVALCQMPELGEPAGHGRPAYAVVGGGAGVPPIAADVAADGSEAAGSAGCRAPTVDVPDPLGDGMRTMFQLPDPIADGSLDIVGTTWAPVTLTRDLTRALRRNDDIAVFGTRSRAIRTGDGVLVGVQLKSKPGDGDAVHIATDAADDPARRVPSTVKVPISPLSGIRDLYTHHREGKRARALHSDLSTGQYYTGDRPFATWLVERTAYFLIPAGGVGPQLRPLAFRAGEGGTPDAAGMGPEPGFLATDGMFGWVPDCIEQLLVHEPLVLDDVEVSYSTDWVTFCFLASDDDLDLLDEFVDDVGSREGVAEGLIRFVLQEDGVENEQVRPLDVWVEDDRIYLSFPIGLKAYGFHALTEVDILPTDDTDLDDLFEEAARTIGRRLNPTSFEATPGRLQGERECAPRPGSS